MPPLLRGFISNEQFYRDISKGKTDFRGVNLDGLILYNVDIIDLNLDGAILNGAVMLNVTFGGSKKIMNMNNVQMKSCVLQNVGFYDVRLEKTKFNNGYLDRISFNNCYLKNTDFKGASITNISSYKEDGDDIYTYQVPNLAGTYSIDNTDLEIMNEIIDQTLEEIKKAYHSSPQPTYTI